MKRNHFSQFLCAACVGLFQLFASTSVHALEVGKILPTEMCRGYFFLPVTLSAKEGYPEDRTLWFLHDTGASTSYVDPDSIERVSGVEIERGKKVNIRDAVTGPVTFNRLTARATDLDHLSIALGRRIDGLLSFGAFDDFLITLDYVKGEIRLSEGELPRPDGITIYSAKGKDHRPWMEVDFGNRKRRMLVDSGAASGTLTVNKLNKFYLASEPVTVGASVGLKDIETRKAARLDGIAKLGNYDLSNPPLSGTKDTELIGGKVMQHFTWTFDQKNKRVQVIRNDAGSPITFDPLTGHGIVLNPIESGLQVHTILEGSPASKTDLQPGDIVKRIDGKPLTERGCTVKSEGSVTFEIEREGGRKEVSIDLYTLVK